MQLIEESNAGIKRPADSQLMAIGKKNKRKGLESSDEESITWNSESSHEKSSTEEGKSEMGSDKHLGEIVEEDVMSSDESTDEDIPEHRRRPGVKARFCLVLVYADTVKDGDPVSKHKEFLDETFGDSGASGTYHLGLRTDFAHSFNVYLSQKERHLLCARDEVYHLSTSL